jgi:hypothetical protein
MLSIPLLPRSPHRPAKRRTQLHDERVLIGTQAARGKLSHYITRIAHVGLKC